LFRFFENVQGKALGGFGTDSGQALQLLDQAC
jgi:hypothetical protein